MRSTRGFRRDVLKPGVWGYHSPPALSPPKDYNLRAKGWAGVESLQNRWCWKLRDIVTTHRANGPLKFIQEAYWHCWLQSHNCLQTIPLLPFFLYLVFRKRTLHKIWWCNTSNKLQKLPLFWTLWLCFKYKHCQDVFLLASGVKFTCQSWTWHIKFAQITLALQTNSQVAAV